MKGVQLHDGEVVVHCVRGSIYPYVFSISVGMILVVTPFFFFFPLMVFGMAGVVLLGMVSGAGSLLLWRAYVKWTWSQCVLTNQRIIHTKNIGIFDNQVTYSNLKSINDVAHRISGLQRSLMRIGEVRVTFLGVIPSMLFLNIKHPETLRDIIVEMKSSTIYVDGKDSNDIARGKRTEI